MTIELDLEDKRVLTTSEARSQGYTRLIATHACGEVALTAERPDNPDDYVDLSWPADWPECVSTQFLHGQGFDIL